MNDIHIHALPGTRLTLESVVLCANLQSTRVKHLMWLFLTKIHCMQTYCTRPVHGHLDVRRTKQNAAEIKCSCVEHLRMLSQSYFQSNCILARLKL